ncbi:MAG: LamG domain-containing protein [Verrucomicrobiales bacterium]
MIDATITREAGIILRCHALTAYALGGRVPPQSVKPPAHFFALQQLLFPLSLLRVIHLDASFRHPACVTGGFIDFSAVFGSRHPDDIRHFPSAGFGDAHSSGYGDAVTGWNFRMYDGVGSGVGWDLTGGTATLDTWSHVVAVWTGSVGRLFVNGALADATNDPSRSGTYNASPTAIFSVGAYDNGQSPYNGRVDEIAFYPTALSAAAITAHFQAATSTTRGAYSSLVKADGALLYLQQNPPALELAIVHGAPTITFTGVLAQSSTLATWNDLAVTSPYTVPAEGRPTSLFFRVHR